MKFLAFIGRISPFLLAVFVPAFLVLFMINIMFIKPAVEGSSDLVSVEVPRNVSFDELAGILAERNLVRSKFATKILIERIKKNKNSEINFVEGEYEISPALSPTNVILQILEGKTIKRTFQIKEADTIYTVAESIERSGLFPKAVMIQAFKNRSLLIQFKVNAGKPEGYFMPGEYTFTKPITPEMVFETLMKKGQDDFDSSFPNISTRLEKLYLDYYSLLTLASIIEKEAGTLEMKKYVSSVYHNRMLLQIPLESDEALAYGLEKPASQITSYDRDAPGPYNTFLRNGLPATPICTPGKDSISAALFPNRSDFLYFSKQPKTKESFSNTKSEHVQKIKKK